MKYLFVTSKSDLNRWSFSQVFVDFQVIHFTSLKDIAPWCISISTIVDNRLISGGWQCLQKSIHMFVVTKRGCSERSSWPSTRPSSRNGSCRPSLTPPPGEFHSNLSPPLHGTHRLENSLDCTCSSLWSVLWFHQYLFTPVFIDFVDESIYKIRCLLKDKIIFFFTKNSWKIMQTCMVIETTLYSFRIC